MYNKHKNETHTYYNMEEPCKHHAKQNKPDFFFKGQIS